MLVAKVEGNPVFSKKLGRFFLRPAVPSLIFTIFLFAVFSFVAPGFLSAANIEAIFIQVAVIGIVAVALNQVILAGEIDISTSSLIAVCAYVYGTFATKMNSVFIPLLLTLIAGGIIGALNGFLVTKLKLSSFIATLATLSIFRGAVLVYGGPMVLNLPHDTRVLGLGKIFGINISILILLLVFIIFAMLSRHSIWGRNILSVGGNVRAAKLAGIPVNFVIFSSFILVGVSCGLASVIFLSQIGQLQATAATGYELRIISAVAIGGTSMAGGRGSSTAPLIGSILIGVILNGMTILAIPGTYEGLVLGAIIIFAISSDTIRQKVVNKRYERN